MLQVTYGNNLNRSKDLCDENTTLRNFAESHDMDYSGGGLSLDGVSLRAGDLDKTFSELGVKNENCYFMSIVKADNA